MLVGGVLLLLGVADSWALRGWLRGFSIRSSWSTGLIGSLTCFLCVEEGDLYFVTDYDTH